VGDAGAIQQQNPLQREEVELCGGSIHQSPHGGVRRGRHRAGQLQRVDRLSRISDVPSREFHGRPRDPIVGIRDGGAHDFGDEAKMCRLSGKDASILRIGMQKRACQRRVDRGMLEPEAEGLDQKYGLLTLQREFLCSSLRSVAGDVGDRESGRSGVVPAVVSDGG
jgi:hypothetical protein